MGVHSAVDVLSSLLDGYASGAAEVRNVTASTADADSLEAEVELAMALEGGAAAAGDGPLTAELTPEGRILVEFRPPRPPELRSVPASVVVTEEAVRLGEDGDLLLTLDVEISAHAPESRASTTDEGDTEAVAGDPPEATAADTAEAGGATERPLAAVRTDSVPPYEDEPYLRLLYEACDTFEEMRERIDMDVSAETVRRYMIDAGVHEPASYGTTDDATVDGGETPTTGGAPPGVEDEAVPLADDQLLTDGLGLPEDLDVGEVLDAVVESATVYEVERRLGLGQQRTRELLRELDLLDLLLHRVTEDTERECTYEQVAMRMRRRVSGGA